MSQVKEGTTKRHRVNTKNSKVDNYGQVWATQIDPIRTGFNVYRAHARDAREVNVMPKSDGCHLSKKVPKIACQLSLSLSLSTWSAGRKDSLWVQHISLPC